MAINFAMQEKPNSSAVVLMVIVSAVITCGLQLFSQALGPVGVILNLILAFPVAYVGMRAGSPMALVALSIVVAVVIQLTGFTYGLLYLVQFGAASVVLPLLLRHGVSWFKSIVVCLLSTSSIVTVIAIGYTTRMETSVSSIVATYIANEVSGARQIYEQAGLTPEQLDALLAVLDTTALFFQQAYLGLATVAFAIVIAATLFLLGIAARGRYIIPGTLFHDMRLPDLLIWLLIVSGFGLLIKVAVMQQVALNLLTVMLPLYFLQGIAIMTFFFRKKSFSMLSRVFGYVLVLVVNPLPLMVTAIGVFDMWFDFRKPRVKTT